MQTATERMPVADQIKGKKRARILLLLNPENRQAAGTDVNRKAPHAFGAFYTLDRKHPQTRRNWHAHKTAFT